MKSILVTGIGGVVGQGIIRNIHAMSLNIQIVGTNTERVSAGNHLCDFVHRVPFAYDDNYILEIQNLIKLYNVGLIIPSTDYEAYYLSLNQLNLTCPVAASPPAVAAFCLDKYLNYQKFSQVGLPFAASILPSFYKGEFDKIIIKPREGRGSRNIEIDPPTLLKFSDDYVVQEYLDGVELTTAFYVQQNGMLHGHITMERELALGNTSRCEVTFKYDHQINEMLNAIVSHFPFKGSCNIQSRVTNKGIIPFEINCRISGTNSVRSQFGFKDVAYTVQEYLLNQIPDMPVISAGCAVRVIHDVIYPNKSLSEITVRSDDFYIF